MRRLMVVGSMMMLLGTAGGLQTASARCAMVDTPQESQRVDFVVEAVLERVGEAGHFRTVVIWKGASAAPTEFTLRTRQGRGRWPWAQASNVGQRYMLFLSRNGDGYSVARCGQSGDATDALRAQLRASGLTPTAR